MPSKQTSLGQIGNYQQDRLDGFGSAAHIENTSPRLNPTYSNRNQAALMLQDPSQIANIDNDSKTARLLNGAGDLGQTALGSSTRVLGSGIKNGKEWLHSKLSSEAPDSITKKGLLSALMAVFGVKSAGSLLSFIKNLFGTKITGKSPGIFTAAKFLSAGALALGLGRGLLGSSGAMGMNTVWLGVIGFIGLQLLTSGYENPNSIPSKVLDTLGLRDKLINGMNMFAVSNRTKDKEAL